MSNIIKAVSLLSEDLITPEIVRAAAEEHNPQLLQYLPAKYISQELINLIFETEKKCWQRYMESILYPGKESDLRDLLAGCEKQN